MSIVPEDRHAKVIEATSLVELNNEKIAVVFFEVVRNRLQHVNSWPIIAESLSSAFQLANKEGIEVYRKAQEGDYVKILISSDTKSISTVDWVRINALSNLTSDDGVESFGFSLIKSSGPTSVRKDDTLQANDGVCKLIVSRNLKVVTASIVEIGESTRSNTGSNAVLGRLAHIDWQKLADGLVSR